MKKVFKFAGIGVGAIVAISIIASVAGGSSKPAANVNPAPVPVTATVTATRPAVPPAQASAPATAVPATREVPAPAPAATVPPAQVSGLATQFDAGTYEVGTDVKAGKYKTAGPGSDDILKSCAWSRKKDASGDLGSLIAFNIVQGPGVVTINKGEVLDATGSCTWKLAG